MTCLFCFVLLSYLKQFYLGFTITAHGAQLKLSLLNYSDNMWSQILNWSHLTACFHFQKKNDSNKLIERRFPPSIWFGLGIFPISEKFIIYSYQFNNFIIYDLDKIFVSTSIFLKLLHTYNQFYVAHTHTHTPPMHWRSSLTRHKLAFFPLYYNQSAFGVYLDNCST